jgi:outer membrane protein OmpA-like peptidoglycan-associated protein
MLGVLPAKAQYEPRGWSVGAGVGYLLLYPDAALDSGPLVTLRATRDLNRWLGLEAVYYLAQNLDGNSRGPAPEIIESWTASLGVDAVLHLIQEKGSPFDPYVAAGVGFNWYDSVVLSHNIETSLRMGAGLSILLSDSWLARLDARFFLPADDVQAACSIDIGVCYSFGEPYSPFGGNAADAAGRTWRDNVAPVAPVPVAGMARDSQGPIALPQPPMITTPAAAPSAGETVIEPMIGFASGSNKIDPRYFPELDRVAEALKAAPNSVARIEGHSDQTRNSKAEYNRALSLARAQAVVNYLVSVHGISSARLMPVGFGFDRPRYPNDPDRGNAANRRIEVHISAR